MKTTYTIYTSYHQQIFDWFTQRGTSVVIINEGPYSYEIQFPTDDDEVRYGRELRRLIYVMNENFDDYYYCC
jgi:hypothetical protein